MLTFTIYKGVGKPIEWNGIASFHLIYLVVGVVACLLMSFLLSLFLSVGWVVFLALASAALWVGICTYASKKWGLWGYLHLRVQRHTPCRIAMNQRVYSLLK